MILESFRNIFKIPELRTKILYTAFFLIIFRLGSHIPIPGIDIEVLQQVRNSETLPGGGLGGVLTFFSSIMGGSLGNCAIFSLGIMPYISASIIFSLLAKVVPSLEALSKEGPAGQRKINEYTRYATVPLCLIQSIMILKVFKVPLQFGQETLYLVPQDVGFLFDLNAVIALTAGGIFLMWLGEQITEYGIGNGISILIMAGIVASIPFQVRAMWKGSEGGDGIRIVATLLIIFVLIVIAIVYITFGQRKIAVQQAKHVKGHKVYGGQKHFLPLKVNQAGVMPVIFASSLLIFPQVIAGFFSGDGGGSWFSNGSFLYVSVYIVLIYFFSYFWTSLMFQPLEMANQLKENGSFIPGIRPGKKTSEYLEKVMVHITFVGAAFLAAIALAPMFIVIWLGLSDYASVGFAYNLGGTSILIIVGVVLDIVQKLESHLLMRHYEGFTKGKKGSGSRRF